MTKIKKTIAAIAAAISISAVGLTAYADSGTYSFSMENRGEMYLSVSNKVTKTTPWTTNAYVYVEDGNLSSINAAEVAVTSNPNWPENDIITSYRTVSGTGRFWLTYESRYEDDRPSNDEVYLLGRTMGGEVWFYGYWTP